MNEDKDIEKIWNETPEKGILPGSTRKRMWRRISRKTLGETIFSYRNIAAVLVVLVLSSAAIYWSSESPFQNDKMMAVKTYPNDIRLLKLPDGSRIWLNADSKISYPEKFKDHERVVELNGEAFFDIARDTARPFKIKSGEFTTTVLGTSFNIKAYDDKTPKVSVVSGKVKVEKMMEEKKHNLSEKNSTPYKKIELTKGEATIYKEESQGFQKVAFKNQKEIAWKKPLLDIDNKNLKEVMGQLEKVYHVNFVYRDLIQKDYTLRGTLDTRQSIASSLKVISFAIEEIEFEQKNDSIWIIKKQLKNKQHMSE